MQTHTAQLECMCIFSHAHTHPSIKHNMEPNEGQLQDGRPRAASQKVPVRNAIDEDIAGRCDIYNYINYFVFKLAKIFIIKFKILLFTTVEIG